MRRNVLLVSLLLAAGVVLADDLADAASVATATEAKAQQDPTDADSVARATETKAQQDAPEAARVTADAEAHAGTREDPKLISGMSILGNQEAPTSLVIVPWKSSEIGASIGISTMLDDSRQPMDREVFLRALSYYEIRSGVRP